MQVTLGFIGIHSICCTTYVCHACDWAIISWGPMGWDGGLSRGPGNGQGQGESGHAGVSSRGGGGHSPWFWVPTAKRTPGAVAVG